MLSRGQTMRRKRCLEQRPKATANSSDERVTRTCTSSKGLMPSAKRAFPAVPDEAHMTAAAATHRYPFIGLDAMSGYLPFRV